jgi:hypothetical protein
MSAWNSIVVIASLALLFFLCRTEWLRINKARLLWRIIASVMAVSSLVCMALPLTFTQIKTKNGSEIIVATEGVSRDSILSFKKNHKPNAVIVEKDIFLSTDKNEYDSIHVFGYGFTKEELLLLNDRQIVFHPAPVKTGITAANWKRQLKKGEVLTVQGTYVNESLQPVTLLLNGFNTSLDSLIIPSRQTKPFLLQTVPKQNGKAVFSVIALQGKDTLEREPLPMEVQQANAVNVMILAASPDFENKFLKDWLSQNGYAVVAKTTISSNKSDKSLLNTAKISLDRITPAVLDSFDIVVSDETYLSMLPPGELEAIYRQVSAKGMGLIVKGDTISAPREWYTGAFHLFQLPGKPPSHLTLSFGGNMKGKAVLPVEEPRFIRPQNAMQSLVSDSASNTLVAMVTEGSGKVLFTTLGTTYSWLLSGEAVNYYALWNLLLQKAGRQNRLANSFEAMPERPVQYAPVTIALQTMSDGFPVVTTGRSQPAFAQDPLIPYRWQTTWWPSEAGWQEPFRFKELVYNWYVYGKKDWFYIAAAENAQATEIYAAQQQAGRGTARQSGEPEEKPVSLFLFFLPFIICSGFLWLERKIS